MTILAVEAELNRKTPAQSLTDSWDFSALLEEGETINFDSQTLLASIINRGASFCVLYTDPDYFALMNGAWWNKWKYNFLEWFRVMQMEYNPIENYDRHEDWHEDIVDDGKTVLDSDSTDTNTVSAFDSSALQPHDKTTSTMDNTTTLDNDRDLDHTGRIHGNIGVTTSQQMIESELKLRYMNLYNMITDIFIKEMLIHVY